MVKREEIKERKLEDIKNILAEHKERIREKYGVIILDLVLMQEGNKIK
ncbi:MAG TPA: hypothetical protein P5150_06400 [Candidatus Ratteibacteria bacterium]|nr:hypothetical protein [Candidatus Ratteibacteria bacterium]